MSDASDRTIPATPRRRQAAIDAGLMPTATMVAASASVAATLACLPSWCRLVNDSAVESFRLVFRSPTDAGLSEAVQPMAVIVATTAAVVFVAAAVTMTVRLILEPVRFRPSRCLPDASRLDPLRGAARVVSWATAWRLVRGCFAIIAVAGVAGWAVGPLGIEVGQAVGADPLATAIPTWRSLWPTVAAAFGIAAVGFGLERFRFERRIRMTPREYQDELRSLEADPKVKLQRHDARRAMRRAA